MKNINTKNLPEWLKGMPPGAVIIGVTIYNAAMAEVDDAEKARLAALTAIRSQYCENGEAWEKRTDIQDAGRDEVICFRAAQPMDSSGLKWEVVLIEPGLSLGIPKFFWSEELLAASLTVFQGVDINAYELTADYFAHLPIPDSRRLEDVKRYLTAKKVGWVEKVWWEDGVGIKAIISFLPEQKWLPNMIQQGIDQGNTEVLGLSIDTRIRGFEVIVDDWTVIWPTKIVSCSSVDVVTRPAAGGKFIRAVAGLTKEEKTMNELLLLLQKSRPDLLAGKDVEKLKDDEILALARQAMEPPKPKEPQGSGGDGDKRAAQGIDKSEMETAIKTAVQEIETRAACARELDNTLNTSNLPVATQARVRTLFEGKIFTKEVLDSAIKDEKAYLASMNVPDFNLPDQGRISGGLGTIERAQMAVDKAFGLIMDDMKDFTRMERLDHKPFFNDMRAAQDYDGFNDVPAFSGIAEMYVFFTGDSDFSGKFVRENLPADLRAAQSITSSTFSYVLGNTLGRRLVKDYKAANFNEDLLISTRKPVKDFRTQEAVLVGYFGDLATVNPESADYAEIAAVTDEESTYTVGQKGNILTITRKTIINDDISLINRLVSRLGRAARRTHAQYVWNFFINNSNCSDATAWFTAGHSNLGAAALAFSTAVIAYKALATMTEKDSGKVIGLLDDPSVKPTLIYPVALMETGESIVNDEFYYSSNDLTTKTRNPLKGKISGAQVSLLSDSNDWGLLMPPAAIDMIEMGYLNGRQEPEMFVADTPNSEQVFVADKIRHKIRHEYAGAVVDYRSGYKAVVV